MRGILIAILAAVVVALMVAAVLAWMGGDPIACGLIAFCAMLVSCPPKWDPAIRIKERQIERGEHPEA